MNTRPSAPDENPPQTGSWIAPFGDAFIGLNREGIIRRVIGAIAIPPAFPFLQVQGLTWQEFIQHFADPAAHAGLEALWQAVAGGAVAEAYWPPMVPFKTGTVVRLRPVAEDSIVAYAAHLALAAQAHLDTLITSTLQDAAYRLVGLSQSISRGVHGPLTDSQVCAIGTILTLSQNVSQVLDSVRTEFTAPTTSAPLPHDLAALLAFTLNDFDSIPRIRTHQLRLESALPSGTQVYCYAALRDVVRHALTVLLGAINAETAIVLRLQVLDPERAVQLQLEYQTQEPALSSSERLQAVNWRQTQPVNPSTALQQLVNALQSYVYPLGGRAWAEPLAQAEPSAMQLCVVLPRWKPTPS